MVVACPRRLGNLRLTRHNLRIKVAAMCATEHSVGHRCKPDCPSSRRQLQCRPMAGGREGRRLSLPCRPGTREWPAKRAWCKPCRFVRPRGHQRRKLSGVARARQGRLPARRISNHYTGPPAERRFKSKPASSRRPSSGVRCGKWCHIAWPARLQPRRTGGRSPAVYAKYWAARCAASRHSAWTSFDQGMLWPAMKRGYGKGSDPYK